MFSPKFFPLLLFTMKSINFKSRINEQIRSEAKEINTLKQGGIKPLLEKYKPRVLCDIENLRKQSSKESGLRLWIRIQILGMV